MIDAYKRFSIRTHILTILALTALAFLLGWSVQEPWVVGLSSFSLLVLLHFFMTKLNSLLALTAIIVQLVGYACLLVGLKVYGGDLFDTYKINEDLAFYGLASYAITVTAFYLFFSYKFARGRIWINLSTAFILLWVASGIVMLINPLWFVTAFIIGFVAGFLFLLARIPNRKNKPPFQRPILTPAVGKTAEKLFRDNQLEYAKINKVSALKGHYFAYNEHTAFLITVVKPSEQFSVTSSGIISDGMNLVPLIENAQTSLRLNKKELNPDNVCTVLLVLSPFKSLQPIITVNVSKWKQPDHMIGTTNILTPVGFKRFIKATKGEMKPLKPEHLAQIEKISQKLT